MPSLRANQSINGRLHSPCWQIDRHRCLFPQFLLPSTQPPGPWSPKSDRVGSLLPPYLHQCHDSIGPYSGIMMIGGIFREMKDAFGPNHSLWDFGHGLVDTTGPKSEQKGVGGKTGQFSTRLQCRSNSMVWWFKKWACGFEGGLADCRKDQLSWRRALKYVRKRIKADKANVNTYNIFDLRITMWSIASPFKFEIKYFILFYASLSLW